MNVQASGGIETKNWEEQTYAEPGDGVKLARVTATNAFTGDVQGESRVDFLLAYSNDDYCSFVGIELVTGRIGDREGSFVLQQHGAFEAGGIRTSWFVVPGSGTGGLCGLRGEGGYVWGGDHGAPTPYTLDYNFGE